MFSFSLRSHIALNLFVSLPCCLQKAYVSIADATGISKSQYGILVGYGFTFSFVSVGV